MGKKKKNHGKSIFEIFATRVTKATGSNVAFLIALSVVIVWGVTGPMFNYSETWQLVINTGTTIVTFLMVFLIQKSQNKDSMAIQLKLNELVAAHEFASNRLIDVEDLSERELEVLHNYYSMLSELCKKEDSLLHTHSVEEAKEIHEIKNKKRQRLNAIDPSAGKV